MRSWRGRRRRGRSRPTAPTRRWTRHGACLCRGWAVRVGGDHAARRAQRVDGTVSSRIVLWIVVAAAVVALAAIVVFPFVRGRQGQSQIAPAPSAAGPWYEILFTTPKYPDRAADHHGGLDERLVALIDATQRTVDVASYDFDLQNVAQAMARAKGRGVTVRMVTDTDTVNQKDKDVQAALKTVRDAGIQIVDD